MIGDFHFLRPWGLMMLGPIVLFLLFYWRLKPSLHAWADVCDAHLLKYLQHNQSKGHSRSLIPLILSMLLMIFSLAGPTWYQLPAATYKIIQPRVLVLDMSDSMLASDLTPNRLSRAQFKLRDLLARKDLGQFALVAFTGEPFVVSPLTDDGQTISALLPSLTPDIMPVSGQNLTKALMQAKELIKQAGYQQGQVLVLTADSPSASAIALANQLAAQGIFSSIMPMIADDHLNPLFARFAQAGQGQLLKYTPDSSNLNAWISVSNQQQFALNQEDDIPLWRDEGRWFLLPALCFFLPVFRRGWLQRISA